MFEKLKRMWDAFLQTVEYFKSAYKGGTLDEKVQKYTDILHINWLAIAVKKLSNLACNEATFELESDSAQADHIKELLKDIEAHRFDIVSGMLAGGDYYVLPYTDESGNIKHSYLDSSRVRIVDMDGDRIKQAHAVIDYIQPNKNSGKTYFLQRHHALDDNGTLTVSYQIVDENGSAKDVPYWQDLKDTVSTFAGADTIGFGRYKSPVPSRGLSPVYGVPLNFGCSDIEKKITETLKQIEDEFKNAKSVIFTDPRNLYRKGEKADYAIADNVIPIKHSAGDGGAQIEIFNPNIRGSEHWEKLNSYLEKYEQMLGVSKGIFTDNTATATATATAVKRANSDTIALLNAVHTALDDGNKMTLKADCAYMNIRPDLWEYHSDYFDPFEDPAEQWQRLKEAAEAGAVATERLTKWLYPNMTDEEIAEEMASISAAGAESAQSAIERALTM